MDAHRIKTVGEIVGTDQADSPFARVFRIFLTLDVRTEADLLKLSPADQHLWLVYWFNEAVMNGGLDNFLFYGKGKEFVPNTLAALSKIGAWRAYQNATYICSLFPSGQPNEDLKERDAEWRAITQSLGVSQLAELVPNRECWDQDELLTQLLTHRNSA